MDTSTKLSRLSGCGLVFGILSFVAFILIPIALVIGLIVLYKTRQSSGSLKGTSFAILTILLSFTALIFAGFVFLNYQTRSCSFKIPTDSMSPTIKLNERITVDLTAYKTKKPARGDIVVYELLDKGKRRLMCKRIVGLPEEEVEIRNGKIWINGALMEIPGLPENVVYLNRGDFGKTGQAIKIPSRFYYVLGDNPSSSFDSRQHGAIDSRDIEGKYLAKCK